MGVVVAGLGYAAGSAAASAIMGTPKTYGADTSITGITSATIKKGGKGKPAVTVPQIDPSGAIHYFQKAADYQTEFYEKGLNFYGDALKAAGREIEASYASAKAELRPAATAGLAAMNEQLKFLGMDPIQAGADVREKLTGMGDFPELQAGLAAAEQMVDPRDRLEAKQKILAQFDQAQQSAAEEDEKRRLQQLADEFDREYAEEYERAYTPAEVSEKISATPGYQFQLEQGTRAIERQGAAAGMLGSGNTLTALTEYGQQLGMGYFQQHMDRLSEVASRGMTASQQIGAFEVAKGQDIATMAERGGQTALQTMGAIGQAKAQAEYQKGQTWYDAAKTNAMLQMQGIMRGRAQENALARQAMASGPAYQQAATQQAVAAHNMVAGGAMMFARPQMASQVPMATRTGYLNI